MEHRGVEKIVLFTHWANSCIRGRPLTWSSFRHRILHSSLQDPPPSILSAWCEYPLRKSQYIDSILPTQATVWPLEMKDKFKVLWSSLKLGEILHILICTGRDRKGIKYFKNRKGKARLMWKLVYSAVRTMNIQGQTCVLHCSLSLVSPWQGAPPCEGPWQVLKRSVVPPPQDTLHILQPVHSSQTPSTVVRRECVHGTLLRQFWIY